MSAQSKTGLFVIVAIGIVVAAAIVALVLRAKPQAQPEAPAVERTAYTVDGQIRALTNAVGDMSIAHEPIPEFKNGSGEVVGMGAMTMDFTPAEGVDMTGFDVGDEVTFTFEVWWEPVIGYELTEIQHRN